MGCDYYIVRFLDIHFKSTIIAPFRIELERINGYYTLDMDPSDEEKKEEYIKECLKPAIYPIVLFEMDTFYCKPFLYKELVEEELSNNYNNINECKLTWKDISKIIKKEHRFERD
jgi:hypothetical protein